MLNYGGKPNPQKGPETRYLVSFCLIMIMMMAMMTMMIMMMMNVYSSST